MLPFDTGVIHAHRIILAVGSGYFNRKLQEPEYMVCYRATCDYLLRLLTVSQEERVVKFRADEEDGTLVTMAAIKYIYDIDFLDNLSSWAFVSLHLLAMVGAVAEKYDIPGLWERVLENAHDNLAECLSNDDQLKRFLGLAVLWTKVNSTNARFFAFAVRILEQNLTMIRGKAVFQKLLEEVSQLAIALLNLVAEEKSELEGKQKKIEDSK